VVKSVNILKKFLLSIRTLNSSAREMKAGFRKRCDEALQLSNRKYDEKGGLYPKSLISFRKYILNYYNLHNEYVNCILKY